MWNVCKFAETFSFFEIPMFYCLRYFLPLICVFFMVEYFWCNGVRLGVKVKICKMKEQFRFCFHLLDVLQCFLFFEYFLCAGVSLGAKKRETLQMSRNITYFTFFVFYF